MTNNYPVMGQSEALKRVRDGTLWIRSLNLEFSHSYAIFEDPESRFRYAVRECIEDEIWEELARILAMRGGFQGSSSEESP